MIRKEEGLEKPSRHCECMPWGTTLSTFTFLSIIILLWLSQLFSSTSTIFYLISLLQFITTNFIIITFGSTIQTAFILLLSLILLHQQFKLQSYSPSLNIITLLLFFFHLHHFILTLYSYWNAQLFIYKVLSINTYFFGIFLRYV